MSLVKLVKIKSITPIGPRRVLNLYVKKNNNFILANNILTHNSSSGGSGSSAQSSLRNVIEENLDDTRFILTGNYLSKIIDALQSRCTPLTVKTSLKDILERCIHILRSEKIIIKKEDVATFHDKIVKKLYPDIRSIINNLEHWSVTGTLTPREISNDSSIKVMVDYLKDNISKKMKLSDIRQYWLNNETLFSGNYQDLAGRLFDAYSDVPINQIVIAEYLHRMSQVLDPEIQFTAMIFTLMKP